MDIDHMIRYVQHQAKHVYKAIRFAWTLTVCEREDASATEPLLSEMDGNMLYGYEGFSDTRG